MRVGIVGSRSWKDRSAVERYVRSLPDDTVVVSGGARGPDTWAEEAALARGLPRPEIYPPRPEAIKAMGYGGACFARNTVIAERSERVVAFVDSESPTQGAMDTVRKARGMGKKTTVFYPDGRTEGRPEELS